MLACIEGELRMNPIIVYHVVTERPMYQGQTIVLDDTHRNGVYSRVTIFKKIIDGETVTGPLVNLIQSDFLK